MKITTDKQSNKFQPVSITMTFESRQELDAVGRLFNTSVICDYLRSIGGIKENLYDVFETAGADINNINIVLDALKNPYHFQSWVGRKPSNMKFTL